MKLLLTLGFFCIISTAFTQTNKPFFSDSESKTIEINTDINFSSGNSNDKTNRTGNGFLGVTFTDKNTFIGDIYGDISFSVYATNDNIFTLQNSFDKTIFGKSVLIPVNGSQGINSFGIEGGLNKFIKKCCFKNNSNDFINALNDRLGVFFSYRANSLKWKRDTLETNLFINMFGSYINYIIFKSEGDNQVKAAVSAFTGISLRRIGGDYALDSFKSNRILFLGNDKLAFNGLEYGFRLDLNQFYGRMSVTSFKKAENITGLSGNQFLITLGVKSGFKIK